MSHWIGGQMIRGHSLLLAGVALACLAAGPRQTLRVVGVHDGDTLTGLDENKVQHKIRLDGIDAPELGQPFGRAAKQALSDKVFGKDVVVEPKTKDRYGRTIGHVLVDGRDVNLEMLAEGMAWHFKQYDDDARRAQAEEESRAGGKGLWADEHAEPPWEWRRHDRQRNKPVGAR